MFYYYLPIKMSEVSGKTIITIQTILFMAHFRQTCQNDIILN